MIEEMNNEEKLEKFPKSMRKALEKIIERCEKVNIQYDWGTEFLEEDDLLIYIQQGASKRKIKVLGVDDAHKLLNSDFEKCVFIEGYEGAICCYVDGSVEAVVDSIGPEVNKALILCRLTGKDYGEVAKNIKAGKDIRLELVKGGDKGVRVSIGNPSNTLLAMVNYIEEEEVLSVRIEGLQITKNTEAVEQLRQVTDSLFFELRRKRKVSLSISRRYEIETSAWTTRPRKRSRIESEIGFPRYKYDKEPSELYWHAVSAYKMPLLQYLAYYQILEYYFMKYSMLGAKREIANRLKDPEFNVDDDNDILEIVKCVEAKLGRYLRESDQLSDIIRECVSEKDLVSDVSSEPFKEYFKKEYKIVSQCRIIAENKEKDIQEQLADRIYDIRCRIVHTKEDDRRGRIMPFTKEEVLIRRFELPMIENLANKVLIANSKNLAFR